MTFAEIRVEVTRAGDAPSGVVWAVDPRDRTSAQPDGESDLARAALEGATIGLQAVADMGLDVSGHRVHITWVGMNVVDTEATAVRAAACAATADAFGLLDRFELSGDARGWRCEPRRR
ncbi:hypothetical protein ABZS77_05310 [Micromonospora sp. NPDC005298]|uniref:hypothetical protein n=1 Tax=Micromonospora sp. NPDC005298 TaxID=3156873 RepID=UPI0033BEC26D